MPAAAAAALIPLRSKIVSTNVSDDVETAVLLLVVGLIVSELALRGRRARALVAQERQDLASIQGLGALVANGEDADYVLLATPRS